MSVYGKLSKQLKKLKKMRKIKLRVVLEVDVSYVCKNVANLISTIKEGFLDFLYLRQEFTKKHDLVDLTDMSKLTYQMEFPKLLSINIIKD